MAGNGLKLSFSAVLDRGLAIVELLAIRTDGLPLARFQTDCGLPAVRGVDS